MKAPVRHLKRPLPNFAAACLRNPGAGAGEILLKLGFRTRPTTPAGAVHVAGG